MALNSVNTNNAAIVALQSLNITATQLNATEKRISTGYRVADAVDDGAAYAVAQRVRSDVGALTSANEQLGKAKGLLSTTNTALTNISNTLIEARKVLVKLTDSSVIGSERNQYAASYQNYLRNIKTFITDSSYNGKSLIGNISSGRIGSFGSVAVIRNEAGATYLIATFGGSAAFASINFSTAAGGTLLSAAKAKSAVGSTVTPGVFAKIFDKIGDQLAKYGSAAKYVENQVSFNNDKIDSLNVGVGALVDADLAKESAKLQSLQIRQQLGTQALSIANQAPQSLLSLFR